MPNNLSSINLATNKQTPFFDKLMDWILTIGRLIVILTEVVAVIAFVYRFSLDEKLVNLHDAIKQQQNIVSVLKNDESKYRNLQSRITLASTLATKATNYSKTITDVANLMPSGIMIDNLNFNKDRVSIGANVSSVSSLGNLIDSLKAYNGIKSISIDNIENKPPAGLSVDITTMLK